MDERESAYRRIQKIKYNKLEIYSFAGAASCSSFDSDGLSAEVINELYRLRQSS
jgi:hypothetical protein